MALAVYSRFVLHMILICRSMIDNFDLRTISEREPSVKDGHALMVVDRDRAPSLMWSSLRNRE